MIGTLSTRGECYVWRLSALTRPHTAGKMAARCLYILTAYPQYSQVPSINLGNFLMKVLQTKQISLYRIVLKSLLFTTGWHGKVGFSHVSCFPLATFSRGGGGGPSSTNLSNDQLTVKSIPSLYQRKLVLNKSALFVSLDPSKFPPQHHLHRKSVLIHISNRRHLSLRRVLLHTLSINWNLIISYQFISL